jgi:hypothetical protein
MRKGVALPVRAICLILICQLAIPTWGDERINALLIGKVNGGREIEVLFDEEPLIDRVSVPALDQGWGTANNIKYVRQYFPRTYAQMEDFDLFMVLTAEYYLFNPQQDKWMHDRIAEGAGGYNDESVMAIWGPVANSWAGSIVQEAFPNDAPAVVSRPGGFDSPVALYQVEIEEDFADPVFTPYIQYGVERFLAHAPRLVIPRQGTDLMLWNVNGFPWGKTPRMIAWGFGEGRAITDGGCVGDPREAFLGRDNPYGGDMVINMVLYLTQRRLIEDVEVYHSIKGMFSAFDNRVGYLISLVDFVERFGANTEVVQGRIRNLRAAKKLAVERYLESEFQGTREAMDDALSTISDAELLARKVKDSALWWVYLIEWFITTSTLMISCLLVWSLMVRRRLYRSVSSTRLRETRKE